MRGRFYTDTQLPVIKLKGLQKDKTYRISGSGVDICATGETLMKAGLFVACDGEDKKYFKTVSAYSFFVLG